MPNLLISIYGACKSDMLSTQHKAILLQFSAFCLGIVVPSLVFGRALIGVTLGLSLISALLATNHAENWHILRHFFKHPLTRLLLVVFICLALNIPTSLRFDLSWEAWFRTIALLSATFYLLLCLKDQHDLILKTLVWALLATLLATLINLIQIDKPVMNGFMLIMPFALYQCFKDKQRLWMVCGLLLISLYVGCALITTSKASLAGLILMGGAAIFLIGMSRFALWKTLLTLSSFIVIVVLGLSFWLPANLNDTSSSYQSMAYLPIWLVDFHRQLIWLFAIDLADESPWIGLGLNASNYHPLAQATVTDYFGAHFDDYKILAEASILPGHPHSWVLEILLDAGFMGLVPLVLFVMGIFYVSIKNYFLTKHSSLLLLICINIGYWSTGLLNFSFWSAWWQSIYYLGSALAFVLYVQRDKHLS
jgi:O-antigen ligase